MKKAYSKPQIFFDSFELSQSIALGCEKITNQAEYVCIVTEKDSGIVYITNSDCRYTPPGGNDGICYHAPDDSTNVYSS